MKLTWILQHSVKRLFVRLTEFHSFFIALQRSLSLSHSVLNFHISRTSEIIGFNTHFDESVKCDRVQITYV